MRNEDFVQETERWGAHNYHPLPVVLDRGEGCWVWDVEGNRYLDMLAAYSALNQGHRHPRILAAMAEQASRLTLTSRARAVSGAWKSACSSTARSTATRGSARASATRVAASVTPNQSSEAGFWAALDLTAPLLQRGRCGPGAQRRCGRTPA